MTPEDIVDLLTTVTAIDRRTVGEADVWLWREILGQLPKDLALKAVIDHAREQPGVWLEPGHVHARVRAMQRDQRERMSLAELRAEQDRYDARLAPKLLELAESKAIPDDELPVRFIRPSADARISKLLAVPCPYCKAGAGQRCTNGATKQQLRAAAHPARLDAVRRSAAPDPQRTCMCGRHLDDDAYTCDRCQPIIDGPVRKPNDASQTA